MNCQVLFSRKNTKNIIDLSSAVLNKREVKVKQPITTAALDSSEIFCFYSSEKITRAGVCKTLCPQLPDSNTV